MAESKKEVKATTVKDVKLEKAEQSRKNRNAGGKDVEVSILDIVNVRFTKDFKRMKKGKLARISRLAYEVYDKNNCVEKIN